MIFLIFLIPFILFVIYSLLMLVFRRAWLKQIDFVFPEGYVPTTKIAIIIPARNEEQNIKVCIQSILACDYPSHLFEIIVIDDHSSDHTYDKVLEFKLEHVHCIQLKDYVTAEEVGVAYKKKAIEIGVRYSKANYIITTDADCIVPQNWLSSIAAIAERQQSVFIIGPVTYSNQPGWLATFQALDFMTMQGITGAIHQLKWGSMSNGANLTFSKTAFEMVEGYKGADHLASGDDFLLLVKMQKAFPDKISYLKSQKAIVTTMPQPTLKSFFNQRIRWASKSGKYDDKKVTQILLLVYLFNLSILIVVIAAFFVPNLWILLITLLFGKTIFELLFIKSVAIFFDNQKELKYYLFFQPLHIVYIVLAGFLGFWGSYQWKGRRVK